MKTGKQADAKLPLIRPFLRWPGNKYVIADLIRRNLPQANRLIEPFTGTGAVFLNTTYTRYYLAEKNADLIGLYQHLQTYGKLFIQYANEFFSETFNTAKAYYSLRAQFNQSTCPWERAALFIYLNKHSFNGLCRYNQRGKFNVPFGFRQSVKFPWVKLTNFCQKTQHASFVCQDFKKTMAIAKKGDVIYCDPPYVPLSKTACFTQYCDARFSLEEQQALAESARISSKKGIPVVISNHDLAWTRELYAGAEFISIQVPRSISCLAKTRRPVHELLAIFKL